MKRLTGPIIALLLLCFSLSAFTQIPVYNSYPSASATVYLDFDGHLVTGTSWNTTGDIACSPSNLTTAQITEIFNRVSEDYRPFNVNITTDSTKYWAAPAYKRMRVILTTSSSWYGSAGGVSYVGSFLWGDNTPAFVFTALLGYNTKNVAEAASHEIGHTVGLNHQSSWDVNCNKLSEYNSGLGSGEIGWAPIMGNSYSRNMTLWNNGANPFGCTSFQDDLGIITANGFSYRADDHSTTTAGATTINFSANQFYVDGIIEKESDEDVFEVNIAANGTFHVDAKPYSIATGSSGSDLDVQVELLSSTQSVLGTYNPSNLLAATLDTVLNPGTYYLRVAGKGNIYAPQYASLGFYSLTGSFTQSTILPVHKLELHGTSENNKHKFDWIVVADEKIIAQLLEVSSDGRNFQTVGSVDANSRSYSYTPSEKGLLYYRLKITLDNKQEKYSNIVSLRNELVRSKPLLATNIVHSSVSVNSPSRFNYSITDYSGRIIAKGNIAEGMNVINTNSFSSGMYIIRFNNEAESYAEKLMKQ
ncbi:MAG: zinc-dependent metalloprotease [Flavisolibacter sp.]